MTAKPMWAGLSIISMWIAVLFVGVFGGNIDSANGSTGSSSSMPVVVVVAAVALICTFAIGRRAFVAPADESELREGLEEERRAREALEAEVIELQAKLPG